MAQNKLTLEEAMQQLEAIVKQLEEGNVPLEESLTLYQKGIEISKFIHEKLKNVEGELAKVVNESGQLEPFQFEGEGK